MQVSNTMSSICIIVGVALVMLATTTYAKPYDFNSHPVSSTKIRFNSVRARRQATVPAGVICRGLGANLPTVCKLIDSGLGWLFNSPKLGPIKDLCRQLLSGDLPDISAATGGVLPPEAAKAVRDFIAAFVNVTSASPVDPTVQEVCETVAAKTVDACNFLLDMSKKHAQGDFQWLCHLVPQSGILALCTKSASGLLSTCRVALGLDKFVDLVAGKDPIADSLPVVRKTPGEVCVDLAPSMTTACTFFKDAGRVIFGNVTGEKIESACGMVQSALSVSFLEGAVSGVKHVGLKACDGFVRAFAPICQKVSLNQVTFFIGLSWICDLAGNYTGACRTFVSKLTAICRADTTNCNANITVADFSCTDKPDGYYPDPDHKCANYYFRCLKGKKITVGCYKGANYVYVPDRQTCRNRLDVPGCEREMSPCLSNAGYIPEKANPRKIDCDPDIPAVTTFSMKAPSKSSCDQSKRPVLSLQELPRLNDSATAFDCSGRHEGKYANPNNPCSAVFFKCKKGGEVKKYACDKDSRVYVREKQLFGNTKGFCRQRAQVPGCQLPPCPVYHPLRLTCDPFTPALPDEYYTNSYAFSCAGKPAGVYADPFSPCASHFYVCLDQGYPGTRVNCNLFDDWRDYVFVDELQLCVPRYDVKRCIDYFAPCKRSDQQRINLDMAKEMLGNGCPV